MMFKAILKKNRLRHTLLSMILPALAVTGAGAQDGKVVFPSGPLTIAGAMEAVENQTRHVFIYDPSVLDTSRDIVLDPEINTVAGFLEVLRRQTGFPLILRRHYVIVNTSPDRTVPLASAPRTSDRYTPNTLSNIDVPIVFRPMTEEIRPDTTIYIPEVETERPEPVSSYLPVDLYKPIGGSIPFAAAKVNVLYGAAALTPNIAFEFGAGKRHTVEIAASHNRWHQKARPDTDDKLLHWIVRPEYRYWLCERYNGHFFGAHAFYAAYNISGKTVPLLFKDNHRYEGYAVGGGVSYGYHWAFAPRWGVEFNIGLGAAYMDYERFDCKLCDRNGQATTKTYFGPTRAGVSLVFMIK